MGEAMLEPDDVRGAPEDVIYDIVRTAAGTLYTMERLFSKDHPRLIQMAKFHALLHVESIAEEIAKDG